MSRGEKESREDQVVATNGDLDANMWMGSDTATTMGDSEGWQIRRLDEDSGGKSISRVDMGVGMEHWILELFHLHRLEGGRMLVAMDLDPTSNNLALKSTTY